MTSPSVDKELQERLREASAIGDLEEVQTLVHSGVHVNSQNEINGWTCLHWACKRNHRQIVSYLLSAGADKDVFTSKGETAAQLTSKPDIRKLLGVEETEITETKEPELPIIPNYLANPPFPYVKTEMTDLSEPHSGTSCIAEEFGHDSPSPAVSPDLSTRIPVAEQNGVSLHPPGAMNGTASEPHHEYTQQHLTQNGPPLLVPNGNASSPVAPTRQQSIPQQLNSNPLGSMPTFQPFFFTGAFPMNMQELVLKVRIQDSAVKENDFIEIELDRQELTLRALLRVCCRELGVSVDHVEKIRKLPNTMLRKDKDVARLQDFQELEVVVEKVETLSLLGGQASLTERPCYNRKASKLTY
ncbi:ankyrin repeat domain-containing protein 40-like [Polyodon spathula]|uniref:ankyrin repeat domain-containing protein 40-like n=1 Tax=Polyodon spathula TaxID=7913 RepID=UPI001B7DBD7B|nr:ankyrin repeat domain-containing protein 40-like [Polyodon spathula]XP_041077009.1 ankyrin repeat domain-containing protein 40-like [Polyodon spathula]